MNQVYAEPSPARAEAMETKKKAPRSEPRDAFRDETRGPLSAIENMCADLLDHVQAVSPRRGDVVRMVPENVIADARNDVGHGQSSNALRPSPGARRSVDPRELVVADERELGRLLDDSAP